MRQPRNPWLLSLLLFVIWLAIVVGGELLSTGGDATSLDAMVQSQIVPALVIAPLFLLAVVAYIKWWRQVGFTEFAGARSLLLLWLPVLGILIMLGIGLPDNTLGSQVLLFVLINSLLVGISEELMLRGIVLYGASTRFGLWRAIWISSILFGLIHTANGFLTGEFGPAFMQALFAFGSGVMFVGLRLRMRNIIPAMLMHGLWDFSVFSATGNPLGSLGLIFPILFFVYGLWLVRVYRHDNIRI